MSEFETLGDVKAEVRRMDPVLDEDDEGFKAATVLLASVIVGQNQQKLVKFTGYRNTLIAKFAANLRRSGVWQKGKMADSGWFEKDGGTAFWLDVCIARGLLKRV